MGVGGRGVQVDIRGVNLSQGGQYGSTGEGESVCVLGRKIQIIVF